MSCRRECVGLSHATDHHDTLSRQFRGRTNSAFTSWTDILSRRRRQLTVLVNVWLLFQSLYDQVSALVIELAALSEGMEDSFC